MPIDVNITPVRLYTKGVEDEQYFAVRVADRWSFESFNNNYHRFHYCYYRCVRPFLPSTRQLGQANALKVATLQKFRTKIRLREKRTLSPIHSFSAALLQNDKREIIVNECARRHHSNNIEMTAILYA